MLSDGAHDLVDALATEVGCRVDREVAQAVDFLHLIEKLGAASRLLEGDPARNLARWRLQLLNASTPRAASCVSFAHSAASTCR